MQLAHNLHKQQNNKTKFVHVRIHLSALITIDMASLITDAVKL